MNEMLHHRRFWMLMTAPILVFIMARLVFLANLPPLGVTSPPISAARIQKVHPLIVRTPVAKAPVSVPVLAPVVQAEVLAVQMNSIQREYHYTFSGRVLCGTAGCVQNVRIHLDTDYNAGLSHIVRSAEDGTFSTEMTFKEYARRPADWRMSVLVPDDLSVEVRGRTILSDETELSTERTLVLP